MSKEEAAGTANPTFDFMAESLVHGIESCDHQDIAKFRKGNDAAHAHEILG